MYRIENVVCYPFRTATLVDNGTIEGQIGEGCKWVAQTGLASSHLIHLTRWGINVFKISELSNSRPLTAVAYTVFQERDLINQFKIPPTSLLSLLLTLEEHYLTEVPYHNSSHAADVTLSMNTLLNSQALESVFTPLEVNMVTWKILTATSS